MAPKLATGMDPLGEISDSEEAGSDGGEGAACEPPQPAPAKAKEVDFETLQRAGYRGCVGGAPPAPAAATTDDATLCTRVRVRCALR